MRKKKGRKETTLYAYNVMHEYYCRLCSALFFCGVFRGYARPASSGKLGDRLRGVLLRDSLRSHVSDTHIISLSLSLSYAIQMRENPAMRKKKKKKHTDATKTTAFHSFRYVVYSSARALSLYSAYIFVGVVDAQ